MSETGVVPVRRAQKVLISTPRYARAEVFAQVPEQCQGCVWLMTAGATLVCPFARCVRKHGWVADSHA